MTVIFRAVGNQFPDGLTGFANGPVELGPGAESPKSELRFLVVTDAL